MRIGRREFDTENHTYIMGILNVTPDSFSDGGKYNRLDQALFHVEEMVGEGMDILDIGGESTRPGYSQVEWEEEASRVLPVIRAVRERFEIPISLDTCKSRVAEEGLQAGADLINDIWGLKSDPGMGAVIARLKAPCVLMHNRKETLYEDFLKDVTEDLRKTLSLADQAGIDREKIILDPGIGFGKTREQNLQMLHSLESLKELGLPVLLGASRKSVIGLTLDQPVTERLEGTLVTTALAVWKGCAFVRVHDIKENVRAVKMAEAVLKAGA